MEIIIDWDFRETKCNFSLSKNRAMFSNLFAHTHTQTHTHTHTLWHNESHLLPGALLHKTEVNKVDPDTNAPRFQHRLGTSSLVLIAPHTQLLTSCPCTPVGEHQQDSFGRGRRESWRRWWWGRSGEWLVELRVGCRLPSHFLGQPTSPPCWCQERGRSTLAQLTPLLYTNSSSPSPKTRTRTWT